VDGDRSFARVGSSFISPVFVLNPPSRGTKGFFAADFSGDLEMLACAAFFEFFSSSFA
jgi:hypothetical protein